MSDSKREALDAVPEANHLYETSPAFKEVVDKLWEKFEAARAVMSDDEYGEFLKWVIAMGEEWVV